MSRRSRHSGCTPLALPARRAPALQRMRGVSCREEQHPAMEQHHPVQRPPVPQPLGRGTGKRLGAASGQGARRGGGGTGRLAASERPADGLNPTAVGNSGAARARDSSPALPSGWVELFAAGKQPSPLGRSPPRWEPPRPAPPAPCPSRRYRLPSLDGAGDSARRGCAAPGTLRRPPGCPPAPQHPQASPGTPPHPAPPPAPPASTTIYLPPASHTLRCISPTRPRTLRVTESRAGLG